MTSKYLLDKHLDWDNNNKNGRIKKNVVEDDTEAPKTPRLRLQGTDNRNGGHAPITSVIEALIDCQKNEFT